MTGRRHERGRDLARPRKQAQHRRGDDAERSFRAHEQVLQRIAGIVLAQPSQAVPDLAVRQHRFEPQHQVAHVAVAQHRDAAGIGRDVAADLARALRADAEREQAVGLEGGRLQIGEDHAGLDGDGVVRWIDLDDPVHALETDQDLAVGNSARDRAGIAALGHDRRPGGRAGPDHRRHLLGAVRHHHQRRCAHPIADPVAEMRRHDFGVVAPAARADDRAQLTDERPGHFGGGLVHSCLHGRECPHDGRGSCPLERRRPLPRRHGTDQPALAIATGSAARAASSPPSACSAGSTIFRYRGPSSAGELQPSSARTRLISS